ncbi:MAG: serine hydrolase [Phycisphaeraceae bacterium]|nr:serine hydrolase [Phycisphaeraceae bacterium]
MPMMTLALATILAFTPPAPETSALPDRSTVENYVRPLIDADLIPGGVVALHARGATVFFGFGSTHLDRASTPDEHTVYEIGSISKVLTGVLLAEAVRRGEVTFDTPVADLLPAGIAPPGTDDDPILLRHLVTHTSGLPRMPGNLIPVDLEAPYSDYTADRLFAFLDGRFTASAPGNRYEYSNLGSGLLGQLLARKAELPYEQLLHERLCAPLGLQDTRCCTEDSSTRLAPPTAHGRVTRPWANMAALSPAGAVRSTPADMLRFAVCQFNPPGSPLAETLAVAREPLHQNGAMQIACGWHIARDGSLWWHNGQTGGYASYLGVVPEEHVAVVVLTNGSAGEVTTVGMQLVDLMLGKAPEPLTLEPARPIDPQRLAALEGRYQAPGGFVLEVRAFNDRLFARGGGQPWFRYDPADNDRFRARGPAVELQFNETEPTPAPAVTIHQGGRATTLGRIDETP